MRGSFITLEGGEGAGKSSQAGRLRRWFEDRGREVVVTREPGGTPLAETLRDLVLHGDHPEMSAMTELLLVFAARAQLLAEVVVPSLDAGRTVISDRFTDASFAYQGGGRGLDDDVIGTLERLVQGDLRPDLVILLDIPVETGLERTRDRGSEDRFESESRAFLERVRQAYLRRARRRPARYVVVDATASEDAVWSHIEAALVDRFAAKDVDREDGDGS